jgi:hypothetical protein
MEIVTPPVWSKTALLSSQVWFGMDSATRGIVHDRWGFDALVNLEFNFLRTHQLTHFIDGATKLGLIGWEFPQLCAAYHCLSNLMGGLDMAYRDEGERAWVFYMPPHAYTGSPTLPSAMGTYLKPEIMLANFRAWQANNGVVLGDERLRFVATDLIFAGGPYDAGYFEFADRPLKESERLLIKLGQEKGRPGPPPSLGPTEWPQARKDTALRKYNAEYAVGGLAEIERARGMEEAVLIAEGSHRAVFVSWARQLVREFGLGNVEDSLTRFADLFQQTFGLVGDKLDIVADGKDRLLVHTFSRLTVPQYDDWAVLPRVIEEAFARAWSVVSRCVGEEIEVTVEASKSDGADATIWRLREVG